VFRHCSRKRAPWYIIPSDKKWYRNVAISQIIIDALDGLKMKYPNSKFDVSKMKVS
jgi:polyphosphate kinase 2 (PPK2 family)